MLVIIQAAGRGDARGVSISPQKSAGTGRLTNVTVPRSGQVAGPFPFALLTRSQGQAGVDLAGAGAVQADFGQLHALLFQLGQPGQ